MPDQSTPRSPPAHRRKGPKSLPRLPISAFTPPNSGTSETFPFPPSPGTAHPCVIVDAHVVATPAQLPQWKSDAGEVFSEKIGGVVLSLQGMHSEIEKALEQFVYSPLIGSFINLISCPSRLQTVPSPTHVMSVGIPFRLQDPPPTITPSYLSSKIPTTLCTVYTETTPEAVASLRWALQQGRPVDIDIQANMKDADAVWEAFEDLITKSTTDIEKPAPIVLSPFISLPIVSN